MVSDLSIEILGGRGISILAKQSATIIDRGARLFDALTDPAGRDDHSIALRIAESRQLLGRFTEGSLGRQIIGHGLGATYAFKTFGRDVDGSRIIVERPNYIHNFYIFLLFKLGLVGMAAVIVALVLWTRAPLSHLRNIPRGEPERAFLAAVVAAWVGFMVWSLASPEILDFRMAPLWGFLVGASGAVIVQGAGKTHPERS